jgi:hypothetical protein
VSLHIEDSGEEFFDDPIEESNEHEERSEGFRFYKKYFLIGAIILGLIGVNGTLASNISINGGRVEYGQGTSGLKTCAQGDLSFSQTVESRAAAHYLKSITVNNIPKSCAGYDLVLSILQPGAAGSSTLNNFFGSVKKLIIFDKASSFFVSIADSAFVTLTSTTDGTVDKLVITFATASINATDIGTIGIETTENTLTGLPCGAGGDCIAGDLGPGGGIVLVSSDTAFAAPGSPCDLNCHFIEVDTSAVNVSDVWTRDSSGNATSGAVGAVYHGFGGGYYNTKLAQESANGANNNPHYDAAASPLPGAISGCWNRKTGGLGAGTNRWYLPTLTEYTWFFYATYLNAAVRTRLSSFPAVTNYYTSEEAASSATFPSLWVTNFAADGLPRLTLTTNNLVAMRTVSGDNSTTNGAISVSPITSANALVSGTYANYEKVQVFPHNKISGYAYICAHAFN